VSAYAVIACDAEVPGLGRCMTEDTPLGEPRTATEARRRLRREGWQRAADGRDLCPEHATPRAPT
jgi:hypothetical protein